MSITQETYLRKADVTGIRHKNGLLFGKTAWGGVKIMLLGYMFDKFAFRNCIT